MNEEQTPLIGDIAEEAPAAENTEGAGGQPAKRHGFSSKLGFVLAAAGSAVGLGNLWGVPYLAAK